MFSSRWKRSGILALSSGAQLRLEKVGEIAISFHLLVDFLAMVKEIGQSSMNLCEGKLRVLASDLLWRQAMLFVICDDILHSDPRPHNKRSLVAITSSSFYDMYRCRRFHNIMVS